MSACFRRPLAGHRRGAEVVDRSGCGSTGMNAQSAKPPRPGIGFTELSNCFATCEDPAVLQAICDRLGSGAIRVFFPCWTWRLPPPAPPLLLPSGCAATVRGLVTSA